MNLDSFLAYPIEQIPYVLIALLVAFSFHEWAHAYVAYRFGDPTAKNQGRLTLNPAAHVDITGILFIFLVGFGWARPVPVNSFFFKKPRMAGVLVSLAGPLSNLLLAFLFMLAFVFAERLGWLNPANGSFYNIFYQLVQMMVYLNVVLFVFNLLPLPPLDGYRIVEDIVPSRVKAKMTQYENYGVFIFLLLALTPLGGYVFTPLFGYAVPAVMGALKQLFIPFLTHSL